MTVYEMAKGYYPRLWDKQRLVELVKAGRLTEAEHEELTGELSSDNNETINFS